MEWDWVWISPGGVKYRAAYAANICLRQSYPAMILMSFYVCFKEVINAPGMIILQFCFSYGVTKILDSGLEPACIQA